MLLLTEYAFFSVLDSSELEEVLHDLEEYVDPKFRQRYFFLVYCVS